MLESKMSAKLKALFPYIMFQNIETSTGLGVPDIAYGHKNVNGWIELKELATQPKRVVSIPWRPGQLAWYSDYRNKYMCTNPYFLILTIGEDWYFIPDIKEIYTIADLFKWYVGETKSLSTIKDFLYKKLMEESCS